jgi:general secretion pathway protein D
MKCVVGLKRAASAAGAGGEAAEAGDLPAAATEAEGIGNSYIRINGSLRQDKEMRKKIAIIGIVLFVGCFLWIVLARGRGKPIPKEENQVPAAQTSSEKAAADQPASASASSESVSAAPEGGRPQDSDTSRGEGFRRAGGRSFGRRSDGGDFPDRPDRFGGAERSDPNQTGDSLEAVQLSDMEMKNIIQKLAEWTNKPVIPVNDEIMQTKITIYSPNKVSRQEALALLVSALYARGVMVDQTGNTVFLKPLAGARLGAVPTLGIDEPLARIADPSQVVEKWYQLSNYNASQMAEVVSSLTADYGHVTADESTKRISVIDTVSNLRRIEQVIMQLDVPESAQTIERIFELKNADPIEVVQVINLILSQDTQGQSRFGQRGQSRSSRGPQGGSSGGTPTPTAPAVVISAGEIPIRLIPMPKQHWILARASREDMAQIESWIKKLDIGDSQEPKQQVFQIRYANVQEVAAMVAQAIREMPGVDMQANLVVQALRETNQIVVFGSDENRKVVEKLIAQIDLPKDDLFIERTFKLQHADPDQIKKNIEGLYETQAGSISTYSYSSGRSSSRYRTINPEETVKVVSYPTMKQVTVIASEKNMERIARQIEQEWDVPLDLRKDQYRILTLQNSDPVKMSDLLTRLFSEESETSGGRSLLRLLFGEEEESKSKIVGSLYGMLTFEPVPDTKKIMVISKIAEAYDVIERLVEELDGQEGAEVPKVITLKYADAEDLCDQLNAILNEPGTTATLQRSVRGLSAYSTEQGSSTTTEIQQQESAGTIRPWWTTQRRDETQMPASNLIGRVRFIPVARSKAVLVLAPPKFMGDIVSMIEQLDQPGMQVMFKVIVMEVNHSKMTSIGVQYTTNPLTFAQPGIDAINTLNELSASVERGSFSFATSSNVNALISLLVEHANARIVIQPTLWTKDNEEATFVKAQKVAFITNNSFDQTNPNAINQAYTFEDVGVTMRIRPNITPEKAVDVTIHLNISQLESQKINDQPTRKNVDTKTHLIVNDGQSIILGGLLFQNDDFLQQKVPLLGDMPVVGGLFKYKNTTLTNNELLVFVTPYVIDDKSLSKFPIEDRADREKQVYEPLNRRTRELSVISETIRREFFDPNSF